MASQLDGAGQAKMQTLDDALGHLQHLHGLVERMAIAVRSQQNTAGFRAQIARAAAPLAGLLKPQFGMIAEQVVALVLISSRGASEQMRLRGLREAVGQIRAQLEISVAKVKESHSVEQKSASAG